MQGRLSRFAVGWGSIAKAESQKVTVIAMAWVVFMSEERGWGGFIYRINRPPCACGRADISTKVTRQ
jgi:hypothetical protein